MNHSVRTMIDMSFACVMFVMAITVGLMLFQSGTSALELSYKAGKAQDRSIHPTLSPIAGDGSVTGAEVLQSIAMIGEIGVEMMVDGIAFGVTLEREDIATTVIQLHRRYVFFYKRGPEGQLQRIIFVSQGGAE